MKKIKTLLKENHIERDTDYFNMVAENYSKDRNLSMKQFIAMNILIERTLLSTLQIYLIGILIHRNSDSTSMPFNSN